MGVMMLPPWLLSMVHVISSAALSPAPVLLTSWEWNWRTGQGSCLVSCHVESNLCCRISLPSMYRGPTNDPRKTQMQARIGRLILQVKHGMGKRNQLSLERGPDKLKSKTAFSAGYTHWNQPLYSIGEAAWKGCQWEWGFSCVVGSVRLSAVLSSTYLGSANSPGIIKCTWESRP